MENTTTITETHDAVQHLNRELVNGAGRLSTNEARYLVNAYYTIQEHRKASATHVRALLASHEPHSAIAWLRDQNGTLEKEIERALDAWTDTLPAARWAKSIVGVGPVISAGLAAHIDLTKCETVGDVWSFADMDPTYQRENGAEPRSNPSLKRLCWKIGESFAGASGRAGDFYGKSFAQRKSHEIAANDAGKFAEQARQKLERRNNTGKNAAAYCAYAHGKLPPAHIHERAKRWVVKLFLSHYFEVALLLDGREPVKPFAISNLNRTHYIPPPNFTGSAMEVN
jgi:hypothetical protein